MSEAKEANKLVYTAKMNVTQAFFDQRRGPRGMHLLEFRNDDRRNIGPIQYATLGMSPFPSGDDALRFASLLNCGYQVKVTFDFEEEPIDRARRLLKIGNNAECIEEALNILERLDK